MSRSSYLFVGIFGSFVISCFAIVLVPQRQIGSLAPQFDEENNVVYPVRNSQGRDVYVSEGCVACHSQQVRDPQNGLDIDRGWGVRRTVARDYIFDEAPLIGSMRLGPDLANIGSKDWRNEEVEDTRKPLRRDAAWHYRHLYQPTAIIRESNMPPYRYLFEKKKISGQRSLDALDVPTEPGFQIVPTQRAMHLVNYLLSLDRSHPLKEVKTPGAAAPAK